MIDLTNQVIFRCVIGSRAYGLSEDQSDTDRRGIYLAPAEMHWSLNGAPEQIENQETQECYWELQKFLTLALKANPNVMECLYTPLVEQATPLAHDLLAMREAFLSKLIYQTYNGYVLSQFKKLVARMDSGREIKWKHAMHLIRLLLAGIVALREGRVPVCVEEHRNRLLAIRRGETTWEEVNDWRVVLHRQLDHAFEMTELPDRPDYERANALLLKARSLRAAETRSMAPIGVRRLPDQAPFPTHHVDALHAVVSKQPYPLLFVTVSGAHLYGFPSPDSDYDVRGVHILPLSEVLGLRASRETIEHSAIQEGIEIDLVTHDVFKFFRLLLKKNGYVLEQLYSPLVLYTTSEHDALKEIATSLITRQHGHHYLGFARTQWKLFSKELHVKALLYVYRVLLTGIHLMRTGEVEANLVRLNTRFKLPYIDELVARKVQGTEKGQIADINLASHEREYERLMHELENAMRRSELPDAPSDSQPLNDLLVRLRLKCSQL